MDAIQRRKEEKTLCPFCNSDKWEVVDCEQATSDGTGYQYWIRCVDCGKDWNEVWFF